MVPLGEAGNTPPNYFAHGLFQLWKWGLRLSAGHERGDRVFDLAYKRMRISLVGVKPIDS
jgi:hypothetical protein